MKKKIKLDEEARNEIYSSYQSALMVDSLELTREGEHATLIMVLRYYNIDVGSIVDAYKMCESILWN